MIQRDLHHLRPEPQLRTPLRRPKYIQHKAIPNSEAIRDPNSLKHSRHHQRAIGFAGRSADTRHARQEHCEYEDGPLPERGQERVPKERTQAEEQDVDAGEVAGLVGADAELGCEYGDAGDDDGRGEAGHHGIDGYLEEEEMLASRGPFLVTKISPRIIRRRWME